MRLGGTLAAGLVATLGVGVAGLGLSGPVASSLPAPAATPLDKSFDPSRFILNGLLAPVLDAEALPLRFVDPRPALGCGSGTSVLVDGKPLRHGELVPVAPFELEWQSAGCRPFGAVGPRFDGGVRLTVYREDWGFSAMVEPRGHQRFTHADGRRTPVARGAAVMPQGLPAEPERAMFLL